MGVGGALALIGGRYQLEVLLGKGGMSEVWSARHVALNTQVAIKFLHGTSARESTRKRFLIEAKVTAQVKSRYAVQVFDFGVTGDGQPFLVMELLDGETIRRRLQRMGRLSFPATVRFLSQAARALDRAHRLGIVHRDFKPDNLMVVYDEEGECIKVLDFGIAKIVHDLDADAGGSPDTVATGPEIPVVGAETLTSFTRTNALLGTPSYMAPEQVANAPGIDQRADVWALGVVAFECLTGQPPFVGANLLTLFDRIQQGQYESPRTLNPELPARFEQWFATACAFDPAQRFASATSAVAGLAAALGAGSGGAVVRRSALDPRSQRTAAHLRSRPILSR